MLLPLLLVACRCDPLDAPQDVRFDTHTVRQVGGRFHGQPDAPLDPAVAFDVQARCPSLTTANLRPANLQVSHVTVTGTGLDRVQRIGAALYDGNLANVHFQRSGDTLEFPIACRRCEIYFGIAAGPDTVAGCLGPGYSLSVEDGRIVP